MAQTATVTKPKPEADAPTPTTRSPLEIDPAMVTLNASGFAYQSWFIRMPPGAISDDLKSPGIWRRVQQSRGTKSLRRHDRVVIVGFDETWTADAVVVDASQSEVVLAVGRVLSLETRIVKLFSDGKYEVFWTGEGYAVRQISDGRRVTQSQPNTALAERDLTLLYPRRETA